MRIKPIKWGKISIGCRQMLRLTQQYWGKHEEAQHPVRQHAVLPCDHEMDRGDKVYQDSRCWAGCRVIALTQSWTWWRWWWPTIVSHKSASGGNTAKIYQGNVTPGWTGNCNTEMWYHNHCKLLWLYCLKNAHLLPYLCNHTDDTCNTKDVCVIYWNIFILNVKWLWCVL